MNETKNSVIGAVARPRTAIALIAVSLFFTGATSEASAKSRKHHHHHKHQKHAGQSTWRNANASMQSSGGSFSGIASFYGNESGSKTASGQRFNQNAMTAAHRSLPFGTKLRVSHGGRSVVVTINDRGPFIRGRVLDLSKGAAQVIGLTGRGVGHVVAERI